MNWFSQGHTGTNSEVHMSQIASCLEEGGLLRTRGVLAPGWSPSPPAVILGLRCGGDSNAARRLWSSHLAEWEVGKVNPEPLGQIWGLQDGH